VDNPGKGAEDTPFLGAPKNTASTATGPANTIRTCPHGGHPAVCVACGSEEWEETTPTGGTFKYITTEAGLKEATRQLLERHNESGGAS
jgi:hypothetical protein